MSSLQNIVNFQKNMWRGSGELPIWYVDKQMIWMGTSRPVIVRTRNVVDPFRMIQDVFHGYRLRQDVLKWEQGRGYEDA